jgi:hypothetical protein
MSERLWRVEFLIGDHECVALDYAGTRVVPLHKYMVVEGDPELASTLHVDVRAPDPELAAERAFELYKEMREIAQLAADDSPEVVTIEEVAGEPRPAHVFMYTAVHMVEQHQFALAVVAAQTYCEMSIRAALEEAAHRQGGGVAELAVSLPVSWALMDRNGPRIFAALLGVPPSDAPVWQSYKAHVARRNAVVHHGAPVTRELANASIDAAVAMVEFVNEASVRGRGDGEAQPSAGGS